MVSPILFFNSLSQVCINVKGRPFAVSPLVKSTSHPSIMVFMRHSAAWIHARKKDVRGQRESGASGRWWKVSSCRKTQNLGLPHEIAPRIYDPTFPLFPALVFHAFIESLELMPLAGEWLATDWNARWRMRPWGWYGVVTQWHGGVSTDSRKWAWSVQWHLLAVSILTLLPSLLPFPEAFPARVVLSCMETSCRLPLGHSPFLNV